MDYETLTDIEMERDTIGYYASLHPLDGYEHVLDSVASHKISVLTSGETAPMDGTVVSIAGLIDTVDIRKTKNGKPWALVDIDDRTGSITAMIFSGLLNQCLHAMVTGVPVAMKGRLDRHEGSSAIIPFEVTILNLGHKETA